MKKVIILSAFATPFRSGAEACAEEISKYLKNDFDVTIITSRMRRNLPAKDVLEGNIPVIRVGIGSKRIDPWLFPFLAALKVKKLKPDLVHAILESFAGYAMVLAKKWLPQAKYLLTLQSTNTDVLLKPMHESADAITAISQTLVDRAKTFGRNDVTLIPNGIALAKIRTSASMHPKISGRVVYVGRLEAMKGIDTLLRAFARLPEQLLNHATLQIVGSGSLFQNLQTLTKQLGIGNRVTFKGYMSGAPLYDAFAQAEVFAGLSRSEALGNVFLEAQAAGCAVLATNVGGIPDIVEHEKTGILIKPEDVQAATESLARLLTDGSLRNLLVAEGQHRAAGYDWAMISERYKEVYTALLS